MKKRILLFLSLILLSQAIPLSAMHHRKRFSRKTSLVKPSLVTLALLLTLAAPAHGLYCPWPGHPVCQEQERREAVERERVESNRRLEEAIRRRQMEESRRTTTSNSNPFNSEAYGAAYGWMAADRNRIDANMRNWNNHINHYGNLGWQQGWR